MKSYTAAEVRAAEQPLLDAGVPLMARAAAALAAETRVLLTGRGIELRSARVLVLAGAGNNGGDALFAAAELARGEAAVTIVKTADRIHDEGLAAAIAAGAALLDGSNAQVGVAAQNSDVVFDGILGTGTSADPALRGRARELVASILVAIEARDSGDGTATTAAAAPRPLVVAVDLPTGIGADDGAVPDPTVLRASMTVTFGGCKAGLLLEPGASYAGRVVVADIGLGPELERVTGGQ
ncbi:MAG: NAD(P)H-hydrate epimerase [Subtercola sp.]|nr:NAD(P)H-hydrate epimerase [Subtercola sp.]